MQWKNKKDSSDVPDAVLRPIVSIITSNLKILSNIKIEKFNSEIGAQNLFKKMWLN